MAYKLAMHDPGAERDREVDVIADHAIRSQPVLLPMGVGDSLPIDEAVNVCNWCPVRCRCRQRSFEADPSRAATQGASFPSDAGAAAARTLEG